MARRQPFVYRHPFVTTAVVLAAELTLIVGLHVLLGWSLLAVALAGLVVLVLAMFLMG